MTRRNYTVQSKVSYFIVEKNFLLARDKAQFEKVAVPAVFFFFQFFLWALRVLKKEVLYGGNIYGIGV